KELRPERPSERPGRDRSWPVMAVFELPCPPPAEHRTYAASQRGSHGESNPTPRVRLSHPLASERRFGIRNEARIARWQFTKIRCLIQTRNGKSNKNSSHSAYDDLQYPGFGGPPTTAARAGEINHARFGIE